MSRLRTVIGSLLLATLLSLTAVGFRPAAAAAAEVLQVQSASLLLVGDSNRTYSVELACITPVESERDQAAAWLRQQLPRRSRVNLRPIGNRDGILLARVQKLGASEDVNRGLIQAGFAEPLAEPPACR